MSDLASTKNSLKARAEKHVGRVLREKWQLDALVGVGAMGAVYAATHRNGARAAIKVLHAELAMDEELRARFLREGYVANKVGHAGVCAVLDDDVSEDGLVYLVLELLEGETLRARWVRAGKHLPAGEVLNVAERVLDVLVAAHDVGIVHRDLKPENIFLSPGGDVKVLDFGIARLREMSSSVQPTRSGAQMGTPAFMAPEQARSKWDAIDGRADLWSLGATMFTLLCGEYVHPRDTGTELLIAAATELARPLRTVLPQIDPRVAAIVDRALAFEPDGRWPDARAMQAAISALRTGAADLEPQTVGRKSDVETRALTMPPAASLAPSSPSPSPSPQPVTTVLPAPPSQQVTTALTAPPPHPTTRLPAPTVRDPALAGQPVAFGSTPPPALGSSPPPALSSAAPPALASASPPPMEMPRPLSNAPVATSVPPPSARRAGRIMGFGLLGFGLAALAWVGVAILGHGFAGQQTKTSGSSIARPAPAARDAAAPHPAPPRATAAPSASASATRPERRPEGERSRPEPSRSHHRANDGLKSF